MGIAIVGRRKEIYVGFKYVDEASDRYSPVDIPSRATLCWRATSMGVAGVTIHRRVPEVCSNYKV